MAQYDSPFKAPLTTKAKEKLNKSQSRKTTLHYSTPPLSSARIHHKHQQRAIQSTNYKRTVCNARQPSPQSTHAPQATREKKMLRSPSRPQRKERNSPQCPQQSHTEQVPKRLFQLSNQFSFSSLNQFSSKKQQTTAKNPQHRPNQT